MAEPRKRQSDDRIAYLREQIGLKQEDMVRLTGIPLRTYVRIERGEGKLNNPGIRYLTNIAAVLGFDPWSDLSSVCRPEWLEWQVFQEGSPKHPPEEEEMPETYQLPPSVEAQGYLDAHRDNRVIAAVAMAIEMIRDDPSNRQVGCSVEEAAERVCGAFNDYTLFDEVIERLRVEDDDDSET